MSSASPQQTISDLAGFRHVWEPRGFAGGDSPVLLLLHGTGGDEYDMLGLGSALAPSAAVLSPRGRVLEGRSNRFFRRLAEGVFDLEDLKLRTSELADFVSKASAHYGFNTGSVTAVGFSNGANIAASLLLTYPKLIESAVLLSPMVPFEPTGQPDLSTARVFIGAGQADGIAPIADAERLGSILRSFGADVSLFTHLSGHTVTQSEIQAAASWLSAAPSQSR